MIKWIAENWTLIVEVALIIYAIAKVITNLTPNTNDNEILVKVVKFIEQLIDLLIPNLKKGGGTHNKHIVERAKEIIKKK